MNLNFALSFALLVTEIDALRVHKTGFFYARGMATRRSDNVLFSSSPEDTLSREQRSSLTPSSSSTNQVSVKEIVLIRHGQTYMNEYIGNGGISFGQPNFTDVFREPEDQEKYHDSPLSDAGTQQAESLRSKLRDLKDDRPGALNALGLMQLFDTPINESNSTRSNAHFLDDLDLVVVSPLTRALQTFEISLYEHITKLGDNRSDVPILAMAAAAERLYLVSDLGKPRSELRFRYPFVDFDTAFAYTHDDGIESSEIISGGACNEKECLDTWHFNPSEEITDGYVEWRPHGEGQLYACLGEPAEYFDRRMSDFYYWLESREDKCIAIVCHAGVIDWMTSGEEFSNCELRVQTFESLRPRALQDRRPHTDQRSDSQPRMPR
mmetsp:Transcript_98/g.262  ORF Transcript_98/g.262 Transcript_98/m.262 type:complete len:380 (-) Transcript_98:1247-2386(-)